MKQIIKLYIHQVPGEEQKALFSDMSDFAWCGALLGTREVEVEFEPFDRDPVEAMVAGLEDQIQKERADSQRRINALLDKISKLQCLEHKQ